MRPAQAAARPRPWPGLTLDLIWLALPPLVLLIILNLQTINPNDFWWHMRTGQIILQRQAIPNVDLFTFSRQGAPWLNQSWLTEIIFYLVYRWGGPALVIFWYALTMAAGYTMLELACLRTAGGRVRMAAVACAVAVTLGVMTWTVRPQATSFALFGLVLFILEDQRLNQPQNEMVAHHLGARASYLPRSAAEGAPANGRLVYWLPALFALWTNLHGGFIFGIALVGVYLLVRVGGDLYKRRGLAPASRRLLVAGMASGLALAVNPSGLSGIADYVMGFLRSSATQDLNLEFQPLSIRQGDGILFFAFCALFLLVLYVRRHRLPVQHLAVLLVFGLVALQSRRALPWFGMAAAPAVAWLLLPDPAPAAENAARGRRERRGPNYVLAGFAVISLLASLPWLRPYVPLIPPDKRAYVTAESTPAQAVAQLCRLGSGQRVFAEISYASYLAWACPSAPFFMDTRFELYPRAMWEDYLKVINAQYGWEEILAKYGVTTILARKSNQKMLTVALAASDTWHVLYEDEYTVLARR